MPEFRSKYFGAVTYKEEAVLRFPLGLPGFAEEKRFLLIEQPVNRPLVFLQSLGRPELCFVALPVLGMCPDYRLAVCPEDLQALGLAGDRQPVIGPEVLCLGIVSLAEGKPPTVNLLAPVVVNWKSRCAVQAIQIDAGYSHEHPLSVSETAGSCS
jgi:flagellar assembly factor FliW